MRGIDPEAIQPALTQNRKCTEANISQNPHSDVQAQPSSVSEGMWQAADRLAMGVGDIGSALRAPFSTSQSRGGEYRMGSGYGSAAVRALRAAPGALAKPISEGQQGKYL